MLVACHCRRRSLLFSLCTWSVVLHWQWLYLFSVMKCTAVLGRVSNRRVLAAWRSVTLVFVCVAHVFLIGCIHWRKSCLEWRLYAATQSLMAWWLYCAVMCKSGIDCLYINWLDPTVFKKVIFFFALKLHVLLMFKLQSKLAVSVRLLFLFFLLCILQLKINIFFQLCINSFLWLYNSTVPSNYILLHRIPFLIRRTVCCYGVAVGSDKELDFAWEMYKRNDSTKEDKDILLFAMSCAKESWLLHRCPWLMHVSGGTAPYNPVRSLPATEPHI